MNQRDTTEQHQGSAEPVTKEEFDHLKSQTVTSSSGWGGRHYPPYAFTEQGVAMPSGGGRRAMMATLQDQQEEGKLLYETITAILEFLGYD